MPAEVWYSRVKQEGWEVIPVTVHERQESFNEMKNYVEEAKDLWNIAHSIFKKTADTDDCLRGNTKIRGCCGRISNLKSDEQISMGVMKERDSKHNIEHRIAEN